MATRKKGRPSAIVKLQDTDSNGKKNWLIFADSGKGKTVLAGTAPRSIFLTVEAAGTESAKAMGSESDEWVIDTKKELDAAYEYFLDGSGCQDYDWVIIDSLSEVEELIWADLQGESSVQKIQDYGTVATKMKRLVDAFNRLPINVLYTAQTMRLEIEDIETEEDQTLLSPLMGTKNGVLSQKICGKVTLIGYLTVRTRKGEDDKPEEYRRLQLRGNSRVTAKDRHLIAPKSGFLRNPTIPDMLERAEKVAAANDAKNASKKTPAKESSASKKTEGED